MTGAQLSYQHSIQIVSLSGPPQLPAVRGQPRIELIRSDTVDGSPS
jgi:hypothetical protein